MKLGFRGGTVIGRGGLSQTWPRGFTAAGGPERSLKVPWKGDGLPLWDPLGSPPAGRFRIIVAETYSSPADV